MTKNPKIFTVNNQEKVNSQHAGLLPHLIILEVNSKDRDPAGQRTGGRAAATLRTQGGSCTCPRMPCHRGRRKARVGTVPEPSGRRRSQGLGLGDPEHEMT